MNRKMSVAPSRTRFLIPVALVAAGFVAAGLLPLTSSATAQASEQVAGPDISVHPEAAPTWALETGADKTLVTIQDAARESTSRAATVYLPGSATNFTLEVVSGGPAKVTAPRGMQIQRGVKVLRLLVEEAGPGPVTVAVSHNGDWASQNEGKAGKLWSPALHGLSRPPLALADKAAGGGPGSYVIVHGPAFTSAMAPLVEWKTRKGFDVTTISTGVTGSTAAGIKEYLQNAYDTWDNPPEYILLLGDVADIPTYSFYGNPSDLDYTLLDGDDWLPDALIGRLPVENDTMARTVINKIVGYERSPYLAGEDDWFTRSIMVGGVEGSDTPPHTVRYCGQQLTKIGFAPAQTFLHPPLPSNMFIANMFNPALDNGASIVAYRGWAYGTSGWSDPRYEVNDMGGMNNQGKLPVVMSFVCLNGDYTASSPCFGEAFLRQGQPDQPKGAVAFIGNGEHWSHTRYNDAMAISFFERIIDPEVTNLGSLVNAGKMRYYDYFPGEVDAETFGEESVEFYFHIYNLLGDPELNFWKSTPRLLSVNHSTTLEIGTGFLEVEVDEADLRGPVAGAVVTAVSGGALVGRAVTDDSGIAWLSFPPVADEASLEITVTGAGLVPYEGTAGTISSAAHVTATTFAVDDAAGNQDGTANPGETLGLILTVANHGTGNTGPFTMELVDVAGPATLGGQTVNFADLASGGTAEAGTALDIEVHAGARDGDVIKLIVEAERSGEQFDQSLLQLVVASPDLQVVSLTPVASGQAGPGETVDLDLTMHAEGSIGTGGGTVELELVNPEGASLVSSQTSFGACAPGATVQSTSPISLQIDADTATGTNLSFLATITTAEGFTFQATCGLVVGPVDVATVCGPDSYGYYAYDSADLDYPAKRPVYQWNEISPTFGGEGTRLDFPVDNEIVTVQVDLPFTFTFYGEDYSRIRVSDNGWISFDLAPLFNFYNWTMPSEHGNNAVIAPYWENLVPTGDGGSNGIAPDGVFYHHDPVAGTFTVEWSRLHHYKPQILGMQTFQVVLLDPASHPTASGDGEMLFYYRDVTNNDYVRNYATVGIENADGLIGMQLSYFSINDPGLAPLQPGLAIRVTTESPVRVPLVLNSLAAEQIGSDVGMAWSLDDERPILGWHIDQVSPEGITRLTEQPLPGTARHWTGPAAVARGESTRFRLTALHPYGTTSQPGEVELEGQTVLGLALHRASPNPTAGQASIAFALPADAQARLQVYDTAGRLVRTLLDGHTSAGEGVRTWDGRDDRGMPAAGGVYFFRLETRGQTLTRKLILVR
jgi:hypothetical protein